MTVFLIKYWKQLVIMIGCFTFGVWITHNHYSAVISDMKATQAEAAKSVAETNLQDYKDAAKSIKEAAASATSEKDTLNVKLDKISKQIKAISVNNPLPADCKPDANRMQNLSDAIQSTNSTLR